MRNTITEGLELGQQLAALPFKAARQVLRDTRAGQRPLGEVFRESLTIGEDLARMPFKLTAAVLAELGQGRPSLEERVADLERRVAGADTPSVPSEPSETP